MNQEIKGEPPQNANKFAKLRQKRANMLAAKARRRELYQLKRIKDLERKKRNESKKKKNPDQLAPKYKKALAEEKNIYRSFEV